MSGKVIHKSLATMPLQPNMVDYEATRREFSWGTARSDLDGLPQGGLNIAYEAVDRHVRHGRGTKTALRWLGRRGEVRNITYDDLHVGSSRFANVLRTLGIQPGERVYSLAGRTPDLFVAAMGTLKNNNVFCPLFAAFGPEPIRQRLEIGDARVLITTEDLFQKKVSSLWAKLPNLKHIILTDAAEDRPSGLWSMPRRMEAASSHFEIVATQPEDMALLHFTSGTTGKPKGAVHVHEAVLMHYVTGKYVLDLHPEDVFWCTADPGWVTGTSYGIIAPLVHGVTSIIDEGDFDADRWFSVLEREHVTVWYTAPTAIRMLMRRGGTPRSAHDLSRLRFIASVGEPLNAEAVLWGREALGVPIHDNWWQTETGGIMLANYAATDIRPGSMGLPLPGVDAAIVRETTGGHVEVISESNREGQLALKPGWPSMFRGYLHDDDRYRKCFADGWYLTGDLARRDPDGYYWFVGRVDDVIKTAGHMVGPFEVESVLMSHPAVSEAGVIGKPDPTIGQIVKAFVTLKHGFEPSDALQMELLGFARTRLGSAIAPKEIAFRDQLPHTRSAKIMRRLLRARELGLPEGDTSTLESNE